MQTLNWTNTVVEAIKEINIATFWHTCRIPDDRLIKIVMPGGAGGTQKQGKPMVGQHKGMNRP